MITRQRTATSATALSCSTPASTKGIMTALAT